MLQCSPCKKYGHKEKVCTVGVLEVKRARSKQDMYSTSPDCVTSSQFLCLVPTALFLIKASIVSISVPTFQTSSRIVSWPFQADNPDSSTLDSRTASSVPKMNYYATQFHKMIILVPNLWFPAPSSTVLSISEFLLAGRNPCSFAGGTLFKSNINLMITMQGGCHCGAVRFEFKTDKKVSVYKCNCSVCHMKQNHHFVVPGEDFNLLKGKDQISLY